MILPVIRCVTLRDTAGEINICLHVWEAEGEQLYRHMVGAGSPKTFRFNQPIT